MVGVVRDRVEVPLCAVVIHRGEEVSRVDRDRTGCVGRDENAADDSGVWIRRLDGGVGSLQHPRVKHGVDRVLKEDHVGLVPHLVSGNLALVALGHQTDEIGVPVQWGWANTTAARPRPARSTAASTPMLRSTAALHHQVDLIPVVERHMELLNVYPHTDANAFTPSPVGRRASCRFFLRPPVQLGVSAADRRRRLDNTCGFNKIEGQRFSRFGHLLFGDSANQGRGYGDDQHAETD